MRKKSLLKVIVFIIVVFLFTANVKAVNAVAKLTLSPTSGSYNNGDTFKVTVGVDSGTEVAGAVDGIGTYDSTRLELTDISKASDLVFTAGECSINKSDGKFSFTCYGQSSVEDKIIKGNLVVMTFKAKATGTANVNFTCTSGSSADSNIIKSLTSADIITCSSNDSGSYTINTSGTTTTTTPTPTTTSSSSTTTSTTTTATELPKTGGIASTVGLIVFGAVSVLSALFLKFL